MGNSSLIFIPGELFFTQSVALAEKLHAKELEAFLALTLESSSPFPLDQLYWGYWRDGAHVLLYAISQKKLFELVDSKALVGTHVLPSFFAPIVNDVDHAATQCVVFGKSLSMLYFEPLAKVPSKVFSFSTDQKIDEALLDLARQKAEAFFDLNSMFFEKRVWSIVQFAREKQHFTFTLANRHLVNGTETTIVNKVDEHILYQADIRPKSQLIAEKKAFGKNALLNKALGLSAVFLFLLLLGYAGLFAGKLFVQKQQLQFEAQAPRVKKIEAQDALVTKIDGIISENFRPFELLEVLNQDRPTTLYFLSSTLENNHRVEIVGVAQNINEVNAYRQRLLTSKDLSSAELDRVESAMGKVTFNLYVNFKK
ncbi:MAG: hypothetical protein A2Y14_02380 [Verrucomicrobia bacterium GWF2_51_19]|nr:MAG: hypothetical protein A2Y14_02380 [Verrucomicrobia bacterium GWF2_51_19]HCJ11961.1 hypothetical protein [Opitutae bacterium]